MLRSWPTSNSDGQHGGTTISGAAPEFQPSARIQNVWIRPRTEAAALNQLTVPWAIYLNEAVAA